MLKNLAGSLLLITMMALCLCSFALQLPHLRQVQFPSPAKIISKDSGDIECLARGSKDVVVLPAYDVSSIQILPNATAFDKTIDMCCSDNPTEVSMELLNAVRPQLRCTLCNFEDAEEGLVSLISRAVENMIHLSHLSPQSSHRHILQCRLTLITSVKCPKWHEDNVQYRLLQTLCGKGTEWVDPSRWEVRALNYVLREIIDRDAVVPSHLIRSARGGEVLIMRGKRGLNRNHLFSAPVLHRSPECSEGNPRLLLSISIP